MLSVLLASGSTFGDLHSNVFIDVALLVTIGILGGKIAEFFKLPKATGYIVIGMIAGPNILNLFNETMIVELKALKILGLGFIGYNVGLEVNFKMLKYNRFAVIFLTLFQSIVTFILVAGMILLFVGEYAWTYALVLGAIATVTTPAPIVACIRSYHTKGRLTALLCPMIALDDVFGAILFAFVLPISVFLAGYTGEALTAATLFGEPLLEIGLSIGIGVVLGLMIERFIEYFFKGDSVTLFLIIVVGLLFGIGITYMLDLSGILLPLTIGSILSNRLNFDLRDRVRTISDAFILPILLIFFTLSGAELEIGLLSTIEVIGVVYLFFRVAGKLLGAFTSSVLIKEETKVKKYLGLALIPQGGVAIDMAILAEIRFKQLEYETGNPDFALIGSTILIVVFAAVLVYKIFGEIIVKWAFKQANEITHEDHSPHAHLV